MRCEKNSFTIKMNSFENVAELDGCYIQKATGLLDGGYVIRTSDGDFVSDQQGIYVCDSLGEAEQYARAFERDALVKN